MISVGDRQKNCKLKECQARGRKRHRRTSSRLTLDILRGGVPIQNSGYCPEIIIFGSV